MSFDALEIVAGLRAALGELGRDLWGLIQDRGPWGLVALGLFCGAWMVQALDRLIHWRFLGWLRRLRWLWRFGRYGQCVFPGCPKRIPVQHHLCRNHFLAASRYAWEHKDSWRAKDTRSDAFYVYILELDGGRTLYAGQTRNLMRRVQEHCDGTTKTTAGRRPVLAWFEQVPSRQVAVEREADLKHRIDLQPESVRRMVAAFRSR